MADKVIKLKTDDELVLEQSNDSILEKALDYAVVEQKDENILAYSVSGLYTNEKNEKYKEQIENYKRILSKKVGKSYEIITQILEV